MILYLLALGILMLAWYYWLQVVLFVVEQTHAPAARALANDFIKEPDDDL
jgi:hypothetical protein